MHQYSCWKHSSRWDSSLFFVHFRRSSDSLIYKCVDCVQKSQSANHQWSFLAGRIDSDRVSQRIRCISMCAACFESRLRHSTSLLLLSAARKVWVYRISRSLAVIQRSTLWGWVLNDQSASSLIEALSCLLLSFVSGLIEAADRSTCCPLREDWPIDDLCLQRSLLQILQAINILQNRSLLFDLQQEFWNSIIRLCAVRKGCWLSGRCLNSIKVNYY